MVELTEFLNYWRPVTRRDYILIALMVFQVAQVTATLIYLARADG